MKNKDKDILARLKESADPFSVPKGYFDALDDTLMKIAQNESAIEDLGIDENSNLTEQNRLTDLDKEKVETGFTVPDGYFESFEPKIPGNKRAKVVSLKSNMARIISLSIAASILLFFGIQYSNGLHSSTAEIALHEDEISDWIEMDLVTFNSYEIAEVFNDIELEEVAYSEEEIYTYLNEVDIENIILEN